MEAFLPRSLPGYVGIIKQILYLPFEKNEYNKILC